MTIQQGAPTPSMPTWQLILRLIRFQPWRFLYNTVGYSTMTVSWLIPGWVSREFFNSVSGQAPAAYSFWSLIILLLAGLLIRLGGMFGMIKANIPFSYRSQTLLQKNMLGRILELPGAAALPESPGATISRFREDVNELPWFALWLNNLIGNGLFSTVALIIMWRINPTMTLVAFAPLALIVLAANAGTSRIEKYRTATRVAGGQVTSFIAEIFGAAQAVQVARAEKQVIGHFATLNEQRRKSALLDPPLQRAIGVDLYPCGQFGHRYHSAAVGARAPDQKFYGGRFCALCLLSELLH